MLQKPANKDEQQDQTLTRGSLSSCLLGTSYSLHGRTCHTQPPHTCTGIQSVCSQAPSHCAHCTTQLHSLLPNADAPIRKCTVLGPCTHKLRWICTWPRSLAKKPGVPEDNALGKGSVGTISSMRFNHTFLLTKEALMHSCETVGAMECALCIL